MENEKSIQPGETIDNNQLVSIFQCSPQGGMRRSHKTNSLVIISNHIHSIYSDRWVENVLYYTGMGTKGDQRFDFMQNKTLFESRSNNIKVYLFEVFKDKRYTFTGEVQLAEEPHIEKQYDAEGKWREVCIFPVKISHGERPFIPEEVLEKIYQKQEKQAKSYSNETLWRLAQNGKQCPGTKNATCTQYERNPIVAENAKRMANGVCQLCGKEAPFYKKNGEPYLETHHIIWLAKGGSDTIDNTVALCPNCHKKMHIINSNEDKKYLKNKITQLIAHYSAHFIL